MQSTVAVVNHDPPLDSHLIQCHNEQTSQLLLPFENYLIMRSLSWFFLLSLTISLPASKAAEKPLQLRVLSYNIHHGEGIDRVLDLNRIANVINSVHPDIVSLQEVDRKTARVKNQDQPALLAKATSMRVIFAQNIPFQGGDYGNAILSKLEIVNHKNHKLPNHDNGEQRGALQATIKLPGNHGNLTFWATHLDHRSNPKERIDSAKYLVQFARNSPIPLSILAGDLNATPASNVLTIFSKHWFNPIADKPQPTIPVTKPTKQIDFVLAHPQGRWTTKSVTVLDEAVASDHRGILTVFELHP
jgi:endonuclease/exonuclease/phosphatase family metal-dependent hydrolase